MCTMFRQDFHRLALFADFPASHLQQIVPFLEEHCFSRGAVIFEQGQPAKNIYIVVRGAVVIRYKPYDGPVMTVANIAAGQIFGWSAALGHAVYTSAAVADEDSLVVSMRDEDLIQLCQQNPEAGKIFIEKMTAMIAERLYCTRTEIKTILSRRHSIS